MVLRPAEPDSGIVFRRADLNVDIPARYDLVSETRLGTGVETAGAGATGAEASGFTSSGLTASILSDFGSSLEARIRPLGWLA